MRTLLPVLLLSIGSLLSSNIVPGQEMSSHVVVHLKDFDSSKNLKVYNLFKRDDIVSVINSCDILGLVVIEVQADASLSKSELQAYVEVKLSEEFVSDSFEYREGLSRYDVMTQCRSAMQEAVRPAASE